MYILLAGLSHQTAPVEIREKLAFSTTKLEDAYRQLADEKALEGIIILNTCNRTEIYATSRNIAEGEERLRYFLLSHLGIEEDELEKYLYQPNCYDAINHLFRVSSGLDSMILGETQILGQVKDAYQTARDLKASDGVLNTLFQRAIYVGKKVRTETGIDQHAVSVSYAAVELARNVLGNLQDKSVMIVGAGEMGELAARYLISSGVQSIIVSNRSYEKAVEVAAGLGGKAVYFNQLAAEMQHADIVISCTAAKHYVITEEICREVLLSRKGQKILLIDIAVPRDIEPSLENIDGVYLYDIDDLQHVVDSSYRERQKAAESAKYIIKTELDNFNEWLAALYVVPVITGLKAYGERIKENELKRAFNRLGKVSEREQEVISAMANSIVNQMLHFPVVNLKEMAVSNEGHLYAEVVKKLFGLQLEKEEQHEYANCDSGNKR